MTSASSVSRHDIQKSTMTDVTHHRGALDRARHHSVMTAFVCSVSVSTRARICPVFVRVKYGERQPLQVRIHAFAQVARDVLLQRRAELPAQPDEDVLQRRPRP